MDLLVIDPLLTVTMSSFHSVIKGQSVSHLPSLLARKSNQTQLSLMAESKYLLVLVVARLNLLGFSVSTISVMGVGSKWQGCKVH